MARRFQQTEAERLRHHNEEMKLALAENVTILEARRRLAARSRRAFEASIERRQRCGTEAGVAQGQLQSDYVASRPAPKPETPRYWWQDRD